MVIGYDQKKKVLQLYNTNKKIGVMVLIVFLLVIVGCTSGSRGKSPITDVDVRTGTDGLIMEFSKNAPPQSAFEDSEFPIALKLRNLGAFDIKSTTIKTNEIFEGGKNLGSNGDVIETTKKISGTIIFGFETSNVELVNDEDEGGIKFDISGKSIFNPNGGAELVTINAKTKKIGAQSETQPSTILATTCYPYKTIFGASVCIDTDIYGIRRERKACEITDLTFSKGQGAPVAITKIETRMLPQEGDFIKPHFIIHIENKGNGEVVNLSNTEEACTSQSLDYKAFNTILIRATLSGKPLDCRLNKEDPRADPPPPAPATIRLRDKISLVRCTLEVPDDELIDINRDAYKTPLSIELEYGYTFTISKDIIIEKVLTY